MTTFKVGDRVRYVKVDWTVDFGHAYPGDESLRIPIGSEGTVIGYGGAFGCIGNDYVHVIFDGRPSAHPSRSVSVCEWQLEPLSKPKGLSVEEELARLFERTDLLEGPVRQKSPVERLHDKIESVMGWRPK